MVTVRIADFEESFAIHFGTERRSINAYTLASTLVSFADAARAANSVINPGFEIEVVVEAFGGGSFKATLRSVYRGASNLFSNQTLQGLVLGVISNFIYQHTLAPNSIISVDLSTSEVVIEQGDTRIVVPRDVYELTQQAEANPEFVNSLRDAARAIEADEAVTSIGFSVDLNTPTPLPISRSQLQLMATVPASPEETERDFIEIADLEILRAILEKSRRMWEFVRSGMRISAPVLDDGFYQDFFAHRITIAPGDSLRVKLRVRQRRLPEVGIFINESYEVLAVLKHVPQAKQRPLPS